ncbi:MAG: hypothetical protein L6461_08350 [Anaerolineae bacterium]|nr:hypothetical protein [Anaerolineae bacterium]
MLQFSKIKPVQILAVANIPIILLLIGMLILLIGVLGPAPEDGVYDVTLESLVFRGGLIFALPCGLISIIAGGVSLSKGLLKKWMAMIGLLIGIFGVLMGLVIWVGFYMVSNCCGG